ncbi:hypothetical protein KBD45_07850 [Candidatus Dojkabacteria bacterium]|nr:hypothetical protein [Candidatus Dojkabacteria bacterium]
MKERKQAVEELMKFPVHNFKLLGFGIFKQNEGKGQSYGRFDGMYVCEMESGDQAIIVSGANYEYYKAHGALIFGSVSFEDLEQTEMLVERDQGYILVDREDFEKISQNKITKIHPLE